MNSVRTVPVSLELIKEALEHYWRSISIIKDKEEVMIVLHRGTQVVEPFEATLSTTKEVVEVFRL